MPVRTDVNVCLSQLREAACADPNEERHVYEKWCKVILSRAMGPQSVPLVLPCPPGFAASLGLELKYNRGLDVVSGVVAFCVWM